MTAHPREPRSLRLRLSREFLPRFTLPSWVLSAVLHALLVWLMFGLAPRQGVPNGGDEDFKEVGLYPRSVREQNFDPAPSDGDAEAAEEVVPSEAVVDPLATELTTSDVPPVEIQLPSKSVLGPGAAAPVPAPPPVDARNPVQYTGAVGNGGAGGLLGSIGGTTFFGAEAKATRYVYVIDSSGSMLQHDAIAVAKAELIASVQNLDSTKQFQIIFYNNEQQIPMKHPDGKQKLFWATENNKLLARQFIDSVHPNLGTDHLPALQLALGLNPEVIFFLTDAQVPRLEPADLHKIRVRNRGRTQIHAIEFGIGPASPGDNFMRKLAQQNDGSYQYRDVTKFQQRSRLE